MEELTTFVSSRGLVKSCAAHNRNPVSSNAAIDQDLLAQHHAGDSIYVCTDALPEFVRSFLPRIEQLFTLVSGDSDRPASPASPAGLGEEVFSAIVESNLCRAWFAQNVAARHPKLFALPIGLDYHTMWERPGLWGLSQVSPLAQERQLLDTWARSPELSQRYLGAYCNWAGTLDRGDRRQCLEQVDRSVVFVENGQIPRAATWARQAEVLFVLSPEGAGADCHRTWEALLLGCIPIVKRSAMTEMLDRLPVLIVEEWAEVRRSRLENFLTELPRRTFDYANLFRETWMRRIHALPPLAPLELSYGDFRRRITRTTA